MQTSYDTHLAIGLAGQIADTGPNDIVSGLNEQDAAVGFGLGVIQGTADDGFVLPSVTGFTLKGVTVHDHRQYPRGATVASVPDADTCGLMRKGRIRVIAEQDVTPADPVYLRHTADGEGTAPGQFRKDADTDKADAVTTARWVTSGVAGTPVILELNLP